MAKEQAKDPRDPFGGTLSRRIQITPTEEKPERATSLKEKHEELQKAVVDSADRAALELDMARIKNETARLQIEYQNLQRQMGVPEAAIATAPIPAFAGTTAALYDIMELGRKTGIDVTPLIRQIVLGPAAAGASVPPADPAGVPGALWSSLGKILERSLDPAARTAQVDPKLIELEGRMKLQEQLLNRDLTDVKTALQSFVNNKGQADPRTPNEIAVDNVKTMAALIAAVKGLAPEPAPAPVSANSQELAFRYQDRAWEHEEKKLDIEARKTEAAIKAQIEREKMETSRNNMAQIPEMIGAVVAQGILESGKNKGGNTAAPPSAAKPRIALDVSKSKNLPHGVIAIKCPVCQAEVNFATTAKVANCICGQGFDIVLKETDGPTHVDATNIPEAPRQNSAESATEDYMLRRGQ